MSSRPFVIGFKSISWNLLVSGHGKGAPGGIGEDGLSEQQTSLPMVKIWKCLSEQQPMVKI